VLLGPSKYFIQLEKIYAAGHPKGKWHRILNFPAYTTVRSTVEETGKGA
jgi:hypothetical protein